MTEAARIRRPLAALAFLAALAAPVAAWCATLAGTPDRTVVRLGDTFNYVLSLSGADGRELRAPPDTSALARDFDIVMRGRNSRTEVVDGKAVEFNDWIMTLAPKRLGTLTIPSLAMAGATAPPVQIQVVPAVARTAEPIDEPLTMRVEVGDVAPFVQSDIPVTVLIYDRLGMLEASVDKPTAEGATFAPDGGLRSYTRAIGRYQYRVIEQTYLMRAQRSGALEIQPLTLQAKVPGFAGSSAASDMANTLGRGGLPNPWLGPGATTGRSMTVRSNPVSVEVKPRPAGVTGWFLPARQVEVSESWSAPIAAARVGEALTRTIRVEARGASTNQLPPIALPEVDGLRQYEDASRSEFALVKGEAGAVMVKTVSVIPTRPGEMTLPAIEIPWWNVATGTQQVARLPAQTLKARPAALGGVDAPPPMAASGSPASSPPVAAGDAGGGAQDLAGPWLALLLDQARALAAGWGRLPGLPWGLAIGVALCALAVGSLLRRSRRSAPSAAPRAGPGGQRLHMAPADGLRLLEAACRANEAPAAHRAYLAWQRALRSGGAAPPRGEALATATAELRRHLYAGGAEPWDGRPLLAALRQAQRAALREAKGVRGRQLAPLYPR